MATMSNSTQRTGLAAFVLQWAQRLAGKNNSSGTDMISDRKEKRPARIPRAFHYTHKVFTTQVRDRDVWIISPIHRDSDDLILYLHGGGYAQSLTRSHWQMIREIGIQSGATLVVPDYPLVPEAACAEAYDFLDELYANLFQCRESRNIIFMGDEAGGGLALGFARQLRDRQAKQPSRIILFSPWLDVTMDKSVLLQTATKEQAEAFHELQISGQAWAGSLERNDYRVSPIFGDLSNLGPITVFAGTDDLFLPDARKLRQLLSVQNLPYRYEEFPGRVKDWINSRDRNGARVALQRIGELARVRFRRVIPAVG
jgi:epsilon-lactone hydrolase